MQPEPTEHSQNASVGPLPQNPPQSTQHGLFGDPSEPSTPALLPHGDRASLGSSSTEWSLSPTSELASPGGGSDPSGLSPDQLPHNVRSTELDVENLRLSLTSQLDVKTYGALNFANTFETSPSTLNEFPEGKAVQETVSIRQKMVADISQNYSSRSCPIYQPKTCLPSSLCQDDSTHS